jgi:hypothetical protein
MYTTPFYLFLLTGVLALAKCAPLCFMFVGGSEIPAGFLHTGGAINTGNHSPTYDEKTRLKPTTIRSASF